MDHELERQGLAWQTGVWNQMSDVYQREIDQRFTPVVAAVLSRANLLPGERVLDLGTGTGAVAEQAARAVGPRGEVVGVDISAAMLALARQRAEALELANLRYTEGRGEALPAADEAFDVVLASLSLMYVIDRAAAAREIARVLRPGGRLVAAVWAGPEQCDIVRFQQIAGSFAPPPPVPGVGPGALADASPLLGQLEAVGIGARVETEILGFDFPSFIAAWEALAGVTTAQLEPERRQEAQNAVRTALYPDGDAPRNFRNKTQFVLGTRRR
jgi:SAM-dependent methyltransferase